MGMSDRIEAFILELMKQEREECLRIQRNELAEIFGCVPSQINYVIATRFSPERGYTVMSRRGGGGCVMIRRMNCGGNIGDTISETEAEHIISSALADGKITAREAELIRAAVNDLSLKDSGSKDMTRANIMKNIMAVTDREG